jgi:hypothetical protein
MRSVLFTCTLALLAACAPTHGPLWGPDSPRNGAGEVVNPATGTVIPGYPQNGHE